MLSASSLPLRGSNFTSLFGRIHGVLKLSSLRWSLSYNRKILLVESIAPPKDLDVWFYIIDLSYTIFRNLEKNEQIWPFALSLYYFTLYWEWVQCHWGRPFQVLRHGCWSPTLASERPNQKYVNEFIWGKILSHLRDSFFPTCGRTAHF